MIYTVEVEVAIARPPTRQNVRTVWVLVAGNPDLPDFKADTEAQLVACQMAAGHPHVVMPIASRIAALTV